MEKTQPKVYRVSLYPKFDVKVAGVYEFPKCLEGPGSPEEMELFKVLHCLDFKVWADDAQQAVEIAKEHAGNLIEPHHSRKDCLGAYSGIGCGAHFVCDIVQPG